MSEEGKGGLTMLKETIVCVVLVIAIIIGNYIIQNYTKESVKELSSRLNDLKHEILSIEEPDVTKLKEKIEDIKAKWEERHDKLAYYIEHDELEKVENNLTGVSSFVEMEQYAEAVSELDKGVFVLNHIQDKYAFSLENVF